MTTTVFDCSPASVAACMLVAPAASAQTPHHLRHRTAHRRLSRDAPGDDDVLRRHWTVVCADRRSAPQRQVVARADTAAAPTGSRATRNVADFAGTLRRRHQGPRGDVRVVPRRHAHRSRHAAGLRRPTRAFGGVIDRYPRVNQYWTGDNIGDFYVGAKIQPLVGVPPEPGGARACAAWSSCRPARTDAGVSTGKPDFSDRR